MPELDESKLVKDPIQAEKEAYQVKELVGDKIDKEFQKLIAMSQFGLEEEAQESIKIIKQLKEGGIAELDEGKRWKDVMRRAFARMEGMNSYAFNREDFNKENFKGNDFNDFVKFIEVKFGPKLYRAGDMTNNRGYLPIKGTNYLFSLTENESGVVTGVTLYDGGVDLSGLRPLPKPVK